jgi:hypothetical protein
MRAAAQFVISLIDSRCRSTGRVWMLGTDQPTVIVTGVSSGVGLWFQKNITKGYVLQPLSGERVAQMARDPEFQQSGVHWSWGNRQKPGAKPFAQSLSAKANDDRRGQRLWKLSEDLFGLSAACVRN